MIGITRHSVVTMNHVLPRLLKATLLGLAGLLLSACAGRHAILGTGYGWDASRVTVISDVIVSDLRVRHVRLQNADCVSGYSEHLELSGPIGPDSSEVMDRLIQRLHKCQSKSRSIPVATAVYLNSGGGLLKDGYKLGEIFRKNAVQTIITGGQTCASACSVAFLGGTFRTMEHNGLLVFHSPYLVSGIGIDCADRGQVDVLKNYFVGKLGPRNGEYLHQRTMSYCSRSEGWTLNADAAKLFGITTH